METWTLLSDGSVLAVRSGDNTVRAERFSENSWYSAVDGANELAGFVSETAGPTILLSDASVLAIGAAGGTARCAPNADPTRPIAWTAGPGIPNVAAVGGQVSDAAPACLLPNGRVFQAVKGVGGATGGAGSSFLEFDPTGAGAWSAALLPLVQGGPAPSKLRFLLLPTGEVLVSDGTRTLSLFIPAPGASGRAAPTIKSCAASLVPGMTFRVDGTAFNGPSQACVSGAGTSMATNYPLVRLRAVFPSDSIVYCRTAGHTTMGVATGRLETGTDFTVPHNVARGTYRLAVVASGVASVEMTVEVGAGDSRRLGRRSRTSASPNYSTTFGEDELFRRDLSEVHLLIDYISGRADKSLAGLKDIAGFDSNGAEVSSMPPQRAVEEICKISYPPGGSLEANAQQAAFMLMVKDKLNELADPARGLTVAFTAMFVGVALQYPKPSAATPPPVRQVFFSAQAAYPNLEDQAREFRRFYYRLPMAAVLLVLFIVYANWDISVTATVLRQVAEADASYGKLFTAEHGFLPTLKSCTEFRTTGTEKPPVEGAGAGAKPEDANATAADEAHRVACDEAYTARAQQAAGIANLQNLVMQNWRFRPVALSVHLFGPPSAVTMPPSKAINPGAPDLDIATSGGRTIGRSPLESFTLAVVGGLTGIVIPTAFGLLGTLAGLMRTITSKMRDSILAPRDYQVARVALFLGMSAGLSVGLFFNGADPGGDIAKGIGNTITISAAGLSFLAGFGAEAFFTFLDGVLLRLMPPAAAKKTPTP